MVEALVLPIFLLTLATEPAHVFLASTQKYSRKYTHSVSFPNPTFSVAYLISIVHVQSSLPPPFN